VVKERLWQNEMISDFAQQVSLIGFQNGAVENSTLIGQCDLSLDVRYPVF
jgi:hypothetical protein